MQNIPLRGVLKPQKSYVRERSTELVSESAACSPVTSLSGISAKSKAVIAARKKRFAPKSRSGCLTCRARRVKCDESKPRCTRCAKAGHLCRYLTDTEHVPNNGYRLSVEKQNGDSTYDRIANSDSDHNKLTRSLLPVYGTTEETYYLDRFLCVSAPWFSQYSDPTLFHKLLPQRSWHHPALKHSIVAIAIATESARSPKTAESFRLGQRCLQVRQRYHHTLALRHIYASSNISEDVVLLSSAMFWLHDNITSNSRSAMVHLQGFLRILTERKIRRRQTREREDEWENTLLRGLVFSADVADDAFAEALEPDLMLNIRGRLNNPNYLRDFNSINRVGDELRLGLTAIPYSVHAAPTTKSNENGPVTTQDLRRYFERWYKAFISVPDTSPQDKVLIECYYACAALSLQVHEQGGKIRKVEDPQSLSRIDYVLLLLESLDIPSISQAPFGRDVELPIVPILTQLIVLASADEARARAFRLLSSMKRLEGLWASDIVVQMMAIPYPPCGGAMPCSRSKPVESKRTSVGGTDETATKTKCAENPTSADFGDRCKANSESFVLFSESCGSVATDTPASGIGPTVNHVEQPWKRQSSFLDARTLSIDQVSRTKTLLEQQAQNVSLEA